MSAVLPTCGLIIHHGGSGTTASPLDAAPARTLIIRLLDEPSFRAAIISRVEGVLEG